MNRSIAYILKAMFKILLLLPHMSSLKALETKPKDMAKLYNINLLKPNAAKKKTCLVAPYSLLKQDSNLFTKSHNNIKNDSLNNTNNNSSSIWSKIKSIVFHTMYDFCLGFCGLMIIYALHKLACLRSFMRP